MTIQEIGICITAIISLLSLVLSMANFWKSKPKLRIEIVDKKWDAFFGGTRPLQNKDALWHIAGVKFSIVNNSPVSITVSNIRLIVRKEALRLIDTQNEVWQEVEFYFMDNNGDFTTDGSAIYYADQGFSVPFKIGAYDTLTGYALFHFFPAEIKKKCKSKLILDTAIGRITKPISMIEYDKNYTEEDYRDYLQYCRSLGESK